MITKSCGGDGPEVLKGARVSANFLRTLGVEPMLGRSFASEEDTPGGHNVTMISAELWRNRFGSVKSILKNSLDAVPPVEPPQASPQPPHDNIRGAGYFD